LLHALPFFLLRPSPLVTPPAARSSFFVPESCSFTNSTSTPPFVGLASRSPLGKILVGLFFVLFLPSSCLPRCFSLAPSPFFSPHTQNLFQSAIHSSNTLPPVIPPNRLSTSPPYPLPCSSCLRLTVGRPLLHPFTPLFLFSTRLRHFPLSPFPFTTFFFFLLLLQSKWLARLFKRGPSSLSQLFSHYTPHTKKNGPPTAAYLYGFYPNPIVSPFWDDESPRPLNICVANKVFFSSPSIPPSSFF